MAKAARPPTNGVADISDIAVMRDGAGERDLSARRVALDPALRERLAEMKAALRDRGVVITRKRSKLLEVLLASDRHPSASEIHEGVKAFYPGTSLATIYNTIDILKETGQALEIEFSGSANRYDGRIPASHPHLVCLRCEKVEDMDAVAPSAQLRRVSDATGYDIVRCRTDYYGTCPDCLGLDAPDAPGVNAGSA